MASLPHDFADVSLLQRALTHSSTGAGDDNERFEFLGDAALDLIVAEELFHHHSGLREGDLTIQKAWVVSRRTLAEAARALGLDAMARLGRGLSQRTLSRSVLANLYEAVLGAVYLDGGLAAARAFVLSSLHEPLEDVRSQRQAANPKQALQEQCQRRWGVPPDYEVLETRGEAHARAFLVRALVRVDGSERGFPSAWGRTRKEAEGWAAYEALLALEGDGEA